MISRRAKLRGDLSGPVLAIIVTIGVIVAGLALMAWFWWVAPSISRVGIIVIVGQPALIYSGSAQQSYNYILYISVKNVGNAEISVKDIVVNGTSASKVDPTTIKPGQESVIIQASFTFNRPIYASYVECYLLTDAGVYPFKAVVIG